MTSYEDFKKEIEERENLIKRILLHQRDYEFLHASNSPELIRFFNKHPIFKRSKDAIFKLLCIEVHKLFSSNKGDHFRFSLLIDKIDKNKKSADWKDLLNREDMKKIKRLVDEGRKNESKNGLENYRDKYLAHTDEDRSNSDSSFFTKDFKRLIEIATEIIGILKSCILKESWPTEVWLEEDGYNELKKLANNH